MDTPFNLFRSLGCTEARLSTLREQRNEMGVILTLANRKTDAGEEFFTRVDVSEEFPFLVTKMSPYFDR